MDKFPSASFKKFASEKDAWAFVRGVELSSPPEVVKGTLLLTDLKLLEHSMAKVSDPSNELSHQQPVYGLHCV